MVDYNLNPGVTACAPWPCAESVEGMQGKMVQIHSNPEIAAEILATHRREEPAKEVLSLIFLGAYAGLNGWLWSR